MSEFERVWISIHKHILDHHTVQDYGDAVRLYLDVVDPATLFAEEE